MTNIILCERSGIKQWSIVRTLISNELSYIKMGEIHHLENQCKIPVVPIEAQVGEYSIEETI